MSNALLDLQKSLRTEMNDWTDNLVNGVSPDFADYKYRTGVIHGMALAERHLLDLNEKIENAE